MDLSDFSIKLQNFVRERDWDQFHSLENLAKSISIESGELLECFQWQQADASEVVEELADVLTYCLLMAAKLEVDLVQLMADKLAITAQKYPVSKARGRHTKYDSL